MCRQYIVIQINLVASDFLWLTKKPWSKQIEEVLVFDFPFHLKCSPLQKEPWKAIFCFKIIVTELPTPNPIHSGIMVYKLLECLVRPYLDDIKKWRDKTNSKTKDSSNFVPSFCPFTSGIGFGIGFVPPFFYVV